MKKYLLPLLLAVAVLLGVAAVWAVSANVATKTAAQVEGTWMRAGGDDWHLELQVADGKMDYDFVSQQFPDVTETLYSYTYRTVGGRRLAVDYPNGGSKSVVVSFSASGTEMTLTPAITSAEDEEVWTKK